MFLLSVCFLLLSYYFFFFFFVFVFFFFFFFFFFFSLSLLVLNPGLRSSSRIGNGRVTANMDGAPVDDAVRVPDSDTIAMVYKLLHTEGLFLGASSALNVCGAVQVARRLGPGHTVVTVLCDTAAKCVG